MKFLHHLEKSKDFWFLLLISCIFFLLRLPSLFEPYWYGDEGIYQTMATAMNNGSLLYRDIWDNKPPLLYILYALFNGDQFSLRLLSLIFGLLSIVVFFFLSKRVCKPPYVATAFFATFFALPLFEGNIANAENFMLLPILTAGLLLIKSTDHLSKKGYIYAGLFLSLAFLIKIVAIFDLLAFVCFIVFLQYKSIREARRQLRTALPFIYGFVAPLLLTFLFFAYQKSLYPFLSASFQQNIGYVGYGNTLLIPHGLLYIKLFLLIGVVSFLFSKRKKIDHGSLFVYLWLAFSLFSAFFSQRPYTHYILILLPSFCLLIGLLVNAAASRFRHGILLLFVVVLVFCNFDIYKKNISYYQNFITYMMGQKSLASYQKFFDTSVTQWYAIAQFLKNHTDKNDHVFVWGNPAQIYKMSETLPPGRYTVAYHITNSKESMAETEKALIVKKPRFIVIFPTKNYPFSLASYRYVYSIDGAHIYEYLF